VTRLVSSAVCLSGKVKVICHLKQWESSLHSNRIKPVTENPGGYAAIRIHERNRTASFDLNGLSEFYNATNQSSSMPLGNVDSPSINTVVLTP
jgi:hypothetical protein